MVPFLIATAHMHDERRSELRSPIAGSVLYGEGNESLGVTANVSDNGACFYSAKAMASGSSFVCRSKAFGSGPFQARVMWCAEAGNGLYRVGISLQ